MKGDINKADVIDLFGELTDALTLYADRLDREVELIVRPDGTAVLMAASPTCVAGADVDCFEELAVFDNFVDLWSELMQGEAPAGTGETAAEEVLDGAA